ncbi:MULTISPECIES: hypothetical protein [Streptomyces]
MTADLPKRTPGKALEEGTPKELAPLARLEVSLFSVRAGDVVVNSFELARLRRVARGEGTPRAAG